jgi:hypothetical protein
LFCTGTVKASIFHLPKTRCGKNAEAAENGKIFQLFDIFQRSVTRSTINDIRKDGGDNPLQDSPMKESAIRLFSET